MKPIRKDIADLAKRAGRADGWRDFVGMLNPTMAASLQTGELHLPDLSSESNRQKEISSRALFPIVLRRMLRRSYPMKVQNWYITGGQSALFIEDKLESMFAQTNDLEILHKGAASADVNVRRGVASNPIAPIIVLNALTLDPEPSVRLKVVKNERTPLSDIEYLAVDNNEQVRNASLQKLSRIMGEVFVQTKFQI